MNNKKNLEGALAGGPKGTQPNSTLQTKRWSVYEVDQSMGRARALSRANIKYGPNVDYVDPQPSTKTKLKDEVYR